MIKLGITLTYGEGGAGIDFSSEVLILDSAVNPERNVIVLF